MSRSAAGEGRVATGITKTPVLKTFFRGCSDRIWSSTRFLRFKAFSVTATNHSRKQNITHAKYHLVGHKTLIWELWWEECCVLIRKWLENVGSQEKEREESWRCLGKSSEDQSRKNGTRMGERGEAEGCRGLARGKSVCDNWHFGKIVVWNSFQIWYERHSPMWSLKPRMAKYLGFELITREG